mmetsp:Transcript_21889/g.70705  ORF Transcript_21889/g.70705 Transcript_21889/m.70705 type:complete len:134 (-) Transcript_21889:132-533(-)
MWPAQHCSTSDSGKLRQTEQHRCGIESSSAGAGAANVGVEAGAGVGATSGAAPRAGDPVGMGVVDEDAPSLEGPAASLDRLLAEPPADPSDRRLSDLLLPMVAHDSRRLVRGLADAQVLQIWIPALAALRFYC